MKTSSLPASNKGPCCCVSQSEDRVTGIPDYVQRPVRKEVDVSAIGPKKAISQKGYEVVGQKKEAQGMD